MTVKPVHIDRSSSVMSGLESISSPIIPLGGLGTVTMKI